MLHASVGLAAGQPLAFASPTAAVTALARAVASNDQTALRRLLGPQSEDVLSSGDAVADARERARFNAAYQQRHHLAMRDPSHAELLIGDDGWPLPIPLVRTSGHWHFDMVQGRTEILARRIGRDEIEAMQVCLAIVDAEREYAASHLDADGVAVYARRLISHPDQQDGLYWPTAAGEPLSPLGPLLAAAADEGYTDPHLLRRAPFHGYFYRLLEGQGPRAADGARAYLVRGRMIGGFAVIAYPAHYGASGVASFMVNQDGRIFERDLGPDTATVAAAVDEFDPVAGWLETFAHP